jgi:biopolymer transport protein ExbD
MNVFRIPFFLVVVASSLFLRTAIADDLPEKQAGAARVHLANGSVFEAKSVKIENNSLCIELEKGGTIWIEKAELSPQSLHEFLAMRCLNLPNPRRLPCLSLNRWRKN